MLIDTTYKHGNIAGPDTPCNEYGLIRNQDLLQSISQGSIFGGTPRDSEQCCIFRREEICIDPKVRRCMNLDPARSGDENCSSQFRNLFSKRIEELPYTGLQSDLYF